MKTKAKIKNKNQIIRISYKIFKKFKKMLVINKIKLVASNKLKKKSHFQIDRKKFMILKKKIKIKQFLFKII